MVVEVRLTEERLCQDSCVSETVVVAILGGAAVVLGALLGVASSFVTAQLQKKQSTLEAELARRREVESALRVERRISHAHLLGLVELTLLMSRKHRMLRGFDLATDEKEGVTAALTDFADAVELFLRELSVAQAEVALVASLEARVAAGRCCLAVTEHMLAFAGSVTEPVGLYLQARGDEDVPRIRQIRRLFGSVAIDPDDDCSRAANAYQKAARRDIGAE